jgi:Clostripain family
MKTARRKWTILVYLARETNLADAMVFALKSMYRIGIARWLNVVVQFSPKDGAPRRFDLSSIPYPAPGRTGSRRRGFYDKDGCLHRMGREVFTTQRPRADRVLTEAVHGRVTRAALKEFLVSEIRNNDSEHYLVIVSGHASGAVGRSTAQYGFSPGGMQTTDLRALLESVGKKTSRKIDILGMDACLMSMVEICWELRNSARYIVASEGLTPEGGWPYHRVLETFQKDDALTPQEAAREIVSGYLRYYADYVLADRSVDLSVCDVQKVRPLVSAVENLAAGLIEKLSQPAVRDSLLLSHWRAQSYKSDQYTDLWDFCDLLRETCIDQSVRTACARVLTALSDPIHGVVRKSIYSGPAVQHSHGLSIYFPWSEVSANYATFEFGRVTRWVEFLNKYCSVTRREMRGESRPRESFLYPSNHVQTN